MDIDVDEERSRHWVGVKDRVRTPAGKIRSLRFASLLESLEVWTGVRVRVRVRVAGPGWGLNMVVRKAENERLSLRLCLELRLRLRLEGG